jgi:hypothetical protein
MDKESQGARQQDTFKMKEGIPEFLTHHSHVPQELPVPRDKTGRGFNHVLTARALCPRSYICSFTEELRYIFHNLDSQINAYAKLVSLNALQMEMLRSLPTSSRTFSMMRLRPTNLLRKIQVIGMPKKGFCGLRSACG